MARVPSLYQYRGLIYGDFSTFCLFLSRKASREGRLFLKSKNMIQLPSRKRLRQRVLDEYAHLNGIITWAHIHEIEAIMRRIHILNNKLNSFTQIKDDEEKYTYD